MDIFWIVAFIAAVAGFIAWKKGFFKNAESKPSAPVVPIRPSPPAGSDELQVSYASDADLRAFIARTRYTNAVILDDVQINAGFGPPAIFQTQIDGTVRR